MKAMVLCAGFGTRLGDLTREIPKPMLDLNGRPMLAYILANLKRHGFNQIMINLHFNPKVIRDYFGDGSPIGVSLDYSYEPVLMGTAGGVKKVEPFFSGERAFLVHYGDVITDQDYSAMLQFHLHRNALATLLLHQRANSNSVVTLDEESRIVCFLERPTESARGGMNSPCVNSVVCICSEEILGIIPSDKGCDLPRDIFSQVVESGRLFGFPLSGFRCAVDSPERLAQAREALKDGRLKDQTV